jgi:hypothetical protein
MVKEETKKTLLSLDEIKKLFAEKAAKNEEISEKDIMEMAEKNHLSEDEEDELFELVLSTTIFLSMMMKICSRMMTGMMASDEDEEGEDF